MEGDKKKQFLRPWHLETVGPGHSLTNFGFFSFFGNLPWFFGHFGGPALDLFVFLVTSQAFLVILYEIVGFTKRNHTFVAKSLDLLSKTIYFHTNHGIY